ncbi:MAG: hypothetical protein HZB38_08130, partial [Planctomycetes bacterium]|nr:hypothetical protein [Planctomycetota bacterium]
MKPRTLAHGVLLDARAIAATLALVGAAEAQLVRQSPSPTGRNLGGVAFTSPAHGFVVGENHHLLETFDGGTTWVTRMATGYSTDPFYTIRFADSQHGYVAGNNQDAYRTTDGGATWTPMASMLSGSVRDLDFVTPTTGFAGYNGAFTWTPDGGATWELRSGYPDAPIVFGMDFRDENVGLAAGIRSTPWHDGGVYRTDDGGRTWTLASDLGSNDVLWLDSSTAISVGGLDVLRSDDAGLSWYVVSSGLETGLAEVARAGNSSTLAGVSTGGDIWVSSDLGYSWAQMVVGIGVLPASWAVSFFDEMNGWVVGQGGITYRTTDGGYSWQLMNNGCGDEVTDIDFADEDFGVAVTHRGFVFRTDDRGRTWPVTRLRETGIVFGREEGFRTVDAVDRNLILAGGAGGILFRTEDGGQSWYNFGWPNQPDFNADFEIRDIHMVDALNGYLGGFYGIYSAFATFDGGYSWWPIPSVLGSIAAIDARDSLVWMITAGNRIYRSTDGGENFNWLTLPGEVYTLNDLDFVDANNGFVVGWYGYMAKSTNGGASWTPLAYPQNEIYFKVSMTSPTDVMVVGYDNSAYRYFYKKSTNGGATWTRTNLNPQFEDWFAALHARPSGRFWLGGQTGTIVYSPAPPLTITLPNDVPPQVAPQQVYQVPVRIVAGEEAIVPGSETLWVRTSAGAAFETMPLEHVSGADYLAPLPGFRCTDTPQFYVSATGDGGSTVRYPANAPSSWLTTRVGVIENADLLAADFEAGLPTGWSTTGLWHLTSTACLPTGACGGGTWEYFGQDSTCTFNTGVRVSGILRSPTFALPTLQTGQHITLAFCSALDTEYPDNAYGDDDQAQVWWVRS